MIAHLFDGDLDHGAGERRRRHGVLHQVGAAATAIGDIVAENLKRNATVRPDVVEGAATLVHSKDQRAVIARDDPSHQRGERVALGIDSSKNDGLAATEKTDDGVRKHRPRDSPGNLKPLHPGQAGKMEAARELPLATTPGQVLDHLLHITELVEQLVDVLGARAAAFGDPAPATTIN